MSHSWYLYSTHKITQDSSAASNYVCLDTFYLAEICEQNSKYTFLKDSLLNQKLSCWDLNTTPPPIVGRGKWFISSDSTLFALTPITTNAPTGSNYSTQVTLLTGMNNMKIKSITDKELLGIETTITTMWISSSGIHKFTDIKYLTFKN
jgi:hypothetical protein